MPNLLFHRGTRWKGHVRGSTNILASLFLRHGYSVTWLNRPTHFGHATRNWWRGDSPPSWCTKVQRHPDGVLEVLPFTLMPILKFSALGEFLWAHSSRLGYRTIYPSLQSVLADSDQPEPDLIWTTGGDGRALKDAFPRAKRIVQCVDVYEAYAGPAQKKLEIEDYENADAVVAIGYSLASYLMRERNVPRDKLFVIGQGADLGAFAVPKAEPEDIRAAPHPRLVWLGLLAKADPVLIRHALESLPSKEGSLILIGPEVDWARDLAAKDSRVFLLGSRSAEDAVSYLQHCDVGLMLYDQTRSPMQYLGQNPLKLYEMAAAGLPTISTPHREYDFTPNPALVVNSVDDLATAIPKALSEKYDLSRRMLEFANRNSWGDRFLEANSLVRRVLSGSL